MLARVGFHVNGQAAVPPLFILQGLIQDTLEINLVEQLQLEQSRARD